MKRIWILLIAVSWLTGCAGNNNPDGKLATVSATPTPSPTFAVPVMNFVGPGFKFLAPKGFEKIPSANRKMIFAAVDFGADETPSRVVVYRVSGKSNPANLLKFLDRNNRFNISDSCPPAYDCLIRLTPAKTKLGGLPAWTFTSLAKTNGNQQWYRSFLVPSKRVIVELSGNRWMTKARKNAFTQPVLTSWVWR